MLQRGSGADGVNLLAEIINRFYRITKHRDSISHCIAIMEVCLEVNADTVKIRYEVKLCLCLTKYHVMKICPVFD
jgi:hypothetical protein